jgi:hypothetical protein
MEVIFDTEDYLIQIHLPKKDNHLHESITDRNLSYHLKSNYSSASAEAKLACSSNKYCI